MTQLDRIHEISATYAKHGWRLRRILARPETKAALEADATIIAPEVPVTEFEVDALWFARPAIGDREAWEIRLVSDLAYALFETFEADESEEDRQDLLREMESRMRDYAAQG
jgi:hypothetical protein